MTISPISISSPTETPPLIGMDNASATGARFVLIDHDPTAFSPDSAHFYFNCAAFDNNEPVSSRLDTVWTFGYNIGPGGERVDSDEPALALHWENYYHQGGTAPDAAMEWHLQFTPTGDVSALRPLSAYLYRDGSYGQFSFAFSEAFMYDWSGVARITYSFTDATTAIYFNVQSALYFDVNNTAVIAQKNASGSGYTSLLLLNDSNHIVLATHTDIGGSLSVASRVDAFCFNAIADTIVPASGIYAPSGELGLTSGGSERLRVKADGRFGATGARYDQSLSRQTPATGFNITIASTCERLILNPAGTLATGTVTMPASPMNGQICKIASTQVVTALTLSPNTGQTINGALTTLAANGFAEYTYVTADTAWYRTG